MKIFYLTILIICNIFITGCSSFKKPIGIIYQSNLIQLSIQSQFRNIAVFSKTNLNEVSWNFEISSSTNYVILPIENYNKFFYVAASNCIVYLTWLPSSSVDVAGYKIYYSNVSSNYQNVIDVGNVTNVCINNLLNNTNYYFAATAYNTNRDESNFSNEAKWNSGIPVLTIKKL